MSWSQSRDPNDLSVTRIAFIRRKRIGLSQVILFGRMAYPRNEGPLLPSGDR
jgi:hypothetical protein